MDFGHGTLDIRMLGVESWTIGNSFNVSCCMLDVGRHDVGRCTLHVGRQNVGRQTQDVQHSDVGLLTLDVGLWAVDVWTLGVGRGRSYVFSWMLPAAHSTRWTMDVGSWTLEVGRWTRWTYWTRWTLGHSDVRTLAWTLNVNVTLDFGCLTLHVALCTLFAHTLDVVDWTVDIGCWDVGCCGEQSVEV